MKVLMISLDRSILELNSTSASRMKEYGSICDELHIIVLGGRSAQKKELSKNVFVHGAGSVCRFLSIFKAIKIGKKVLSGGADKWLMTAQDPFETGFVGWYLSKKFKIPIEVQLHGDFYGGKYWKKENIKNFFRFYLGKFILKRAGGIRAVSERIKKSIESFTKIKINRMPVYTGITNQNRNSNFLREKFPGAYPIILSVGNLVSVKNHRQLIEVFAEIKKELPNAELVIAGDGPLLKDLRFKISDLRLENDVELAGHQTNLADYYQSADIFVHPSLYEGWGRAVMEAAYFGLPIIMSDTGLAGKVIVNYESGLVVSVNDKKALKDAILCLAKDGVFRKTLGENAKKTAALLIPTKQEYLDKIKESWEALYAG